MNDKNFCKTGRVTPGLTPSAVSGKKSSFVKEGEALAAGEKVKTKLVDLLRLIKN